MSSLRNYSLLFLACVCSCTVHAQSFLEHLTRADGLPGDQVLALHEDRNGFIWIGTGSGLARHEGVRIRTWYHDRKNEHSLPNNVVWDITTDEHGKVWIATDHGLGRYDASTGAFDRVFITEAYHDPTSANRIHRLVADGHGLLWLSTEDGLHTISTDNVAQQVALPGQGASQQSVTDRMHAHGLQNDALRNGLWINTNKGVLFFDRGTRSFITRSSDPAFACLNDTLAQDVLPDGKGGLWYFTRGTKELLHTDHKGAVIHRETILTTTKQLVNPQFIRLDRDGALWLSTWSHELRKRDPQSGLWTEFVHDDAVPWSLVSSNTKSWIQDRTGRIWLGTYLGLDVIDPAHGGVHPTVIGAGASNVDVVELVPLDKQHLLVGTTNGMLMLDRLSGRQQWIEHPDGFGGMDQGTAGMFLTGAVPYGRSWLIGTREGLLDLDTTRIALTRPVPITRAEARLGTNPISFLEPGGTGDVWIGLAIGGLFRLDQRGSVIPFDHGTGELRRIQQLLAATSGPEGLWVGMNNGRGLCLIHNDSIALRALNEADSTGANYGVVLSLARQNDGTLYVGTLMGGLGVRDTRTGSFTWYTRSDGLAGDRVERLLLDDGNSLWILTTDGICRFDTRTHRIDRLGLPASVRALGSFNAMALDPDGSLLCAIGNVLLDVDIERPRLREGPHVVLTALRHGGSMHASWPADSLVELEHDLRALSIEYGALNFFADQNTRFAYRVVGIDSTWTNLGSATRLDLNDLPIGTHRVEVRANTGGTGWTPHPLALAVRVLPPFWGTWWFRLTLVLLIALMVWLGVRSYVRERLREQREHMEREQAVLSERVRIAGDMHDDLGAGLSGLKLRSEMALRVEKDPAKREQLSNLANTAGELIGSMRQIIWTMTADQAGVEDLVVYTGSYARTYCEENSLAIDVQQTGPWPEVLLTTEQRRNIFLVVKEALHNTVKHAQAGSVRLEMQWTQGLSVVIQDDGVGLTKGADQAAGNGLRNMKKRITALGGTLSIEAAEGTRIRFHVPLANPSPNQGSIVSTARG